MGGVCCVIFGFSKESYNSLGLWVYGIGFSSKKSDRLGYENWVLFDLWSMVNILG